MDVAVDDGVEKEYEEWGCGDGCKDGDKREEEGMVKMRGLK